MNTNKNQGKAIMTTDGEYVIYTLTYLGTNKTLTREFPYNEYYSKVVKKK